MERDMTVGNPLKVILYFSIPVAIGNVFQQMYNTVDTIIVGRFVGTKPLAAVGATGSITFLILGLLMGLTAGFNVVVGQKYGAKDMDGVKRSFCSGMSLSAIFGLVLTFLSVVFMDSILKALHTPEDIFADAMLYVIIICGGMILTAGYNMFSGVLRAVGNSRVPLYALILSSLLNIVLDLILTVPLRMGVAGTAYATIFSQGVSAVFCYIYIRKKVPALHFSLSDFKPDFDIIRNQIRIGLPMGLQFSITSIGAIFIQRALNNFGAFHIAAYTTAGKVELILQMVVIAFGTTMSAYCAQNVGAGKIERIRQGIRSVTRIVMIYSVAVGIVAFVYGDMVTSLFVKENIEEVRPLVQFLVRCYACFLVPLGIVNSWRNSIQGMGFGWMPMVGGILELVGRTIMALIAGATGSFLFVGFASPAAWSLAGAYFVFAYFRAIKTLESRHGIQ